VRQPQTRAADVERVVLRYKCRQVKRQTGIQVRQDTNTYLDHSMMPAECPCSKY